MTANTADNFLQLPHNGVYGNKSTVQGVYANLALTSAVALDTLDLVKIPAGALVVSGFLYTTQMTGTGTIVIGVRAADGTSTTALGTGTAMLVGGTASAVVTANVQNNLALRFVPFMNDFDTIIYATYVSGPVPATNDSLGIVVDYVANGTK
jgi:hypothetical protein